MQQVPSLIQSGIGGALNLFELGTDNKYHFVRVVNEIPLNWTYKPPASNMIYKLPVTLPPKPVKQPSRTNSSHTMVASCCSGTGDGNCCGR
jgi:hypothetical protein